MRLCLLSFINLLLITCPTLAFAVKRAYVVYLGAHSHVYEAEFDLLRVQDSHFDLLGSFLGRNAAKEAIFYSYTRHVNGFAAMLEDEEASALAGVWPESESFNDEGMGPIPARWKGKCENDGVRCNRKLIGARYFNKGYLAHLQANITPTATDASHFTPRDADGHGTHTLSTAAGNIVRNANVLGFGNGTAKGGSPRARVAAYKVCWPELEDGGCSEADILAAFDAAISDGVDVISVSLVSNPWPITEDARSIGAFHATMKGIPVVYAAGNDGVNGPSTVCNVSPWQITVGASTTDRDFVNWLQLGNHRRIKGKSMAPNSLPHGKLYPIIGAGDAKLANASADDALLCNIGTLDSKKAKGKILVCLAGGDDSVNINKGEQVALAGGVAMVLANDQYLGDLIDPLLHVLPTTHLTYSDATVVFSYINSTKSPIAHITPAVTELNTKPAPVMAYFSSRGPNSIIPEILKPDITAPGVNIIAAYPEIQGATEELFDNRKVKFNVMSGTSMSCPHVAGVVGLLRTLYPHWSPAAIRSAIMTTVATMDNVMKPILDVASNLEANPFSYGAGHIQPNLAMDPGLVYDLKTEDYLNFLCSTGYNSSSIALFSGKPYVCHTNFTAINLNYPSITVPNLNQSITVSRTLKNVGSPATYKASIRSPTGVKVVVKPNVLTFDKIGQEQTFYLTFKKLNKGSNDYAFGQLTWSDGTHNVRSPIVVKAV